MLIFFYAPLLASVTGSPIPGNFVVYSTESCSGSQRITTEITKTCYDVWDLPKGIDVTTLPDTKSVMFSAQQSIMFATCPSSSCQGCSIPQAINGLKIGGCQSSQFSEFDLIGIPRTQIPDHNGRYSQTGATFNSLPVYKLKNVGYNLFIFWNVGAWRTSDIAGDNLFWWSYYSDYLPYLTSQGNFVNSNSAVFKRESGAQAVTTITVDQSTKIPSFIFEGLKYYSGQWVPAAAPAPAPSPSVATPSSSTNSRLVDCDYTSPCVNGPLTVCMTETVSENGGNMKWNVKFASSIMSCIIEIEYAVTYGVGNSLTLTAGGCAVKENICTGTSCECVCLPNPPVLAGTFSVESNYDTTLKFGDESLVMKSGGCPVSTYLKQGHPAAIGIIVGVVILLIAVAGLTCRYYQRKKTEQNGLYLPLNEPVS